MAFERRGADAGEYLCVVDDWEHCGDVCGRFFSGGDDRAGGDYLGCRAGACGGGKRSDVASADCIGVVRVGDRVDGDAERLAVMVSIFGRMTPVELGFHQVRQ